MKDFKIYQVGGSVRDEILGIPSNDIDYAVEARDFAHMRQIILDMGGTIFLETEKFLTIRANVPNLGATDYVLCRSEQNSIYTDGRHPDKVIAGSIYDDLRRRDFGMNSLAKDIETGEILDPFNGREDLKHMRIRAVGNPVDRINEDKLRALRAIRFAITKKMYIEYKLGNVIEELTVSDFHSVSTERIREELTKMCKYDTFETFKMLALFPNIITLIKERNIWFKPTTEKK